MSERIKVQGKFGEFETTKEGIIESINDCDAFINKESARDARLRPGSVQNQLDHAIAHKSWLVGILGKFS